MAFITVYSALVKAPLLGLADVNATPNPSKAPWYFLGLQELLAYFHPTVAGVLVPTFVLVGAAFIPYIDRGNLQAIRPSQRKTAVVLFSLFCIQLYKFLVSSSFEAEGMVDRIREVVLERGEQERPKFTFEPVNARKRPAFDHVQEKRLGQILSVICRMPAAPSEDVERIPIEPAQLG